MIIFYSIEKNQPKSKQNSYNCQSMPRPTISLCLPLLLALLIAQSHSNLICNGDFESYTLTSNLTFDGIFQEFKLFPNNYSCWYASACGFVEVLKTVYGTGTKGTKLIILLICPISMCQTLTLTIGARYYLSMDVSSMPLVQTATAYAWVNGVKVLTVVHNDYTTVTNGYAEFVANVTTNKVCFNGSASLFPGAVTQHDDYTPILDNIVVDLVPANASSNTSGNSTTPTPTPVNTTSTNTTLNTTLPLPLPPAVPSGPAEQFLRIDMVMKVNDMEGILYLHSDVQTDAYIVQILRDNVRIYIQGELQTRVEYFLDGAGCIGGAITCERSYDLQTIEVSFPSVIEVSSYLKLRLVFTINGREIVLCFMPAWMIKTVQNIQPISQKALTLIIDGYNLLRNFFFSYFIINLLNFFTLTLMYNYLNIGTQPSFSHNFLEKLSQILFLQNNFIQMLAKLFDDGNIDRAFRFQSFVGQGEKIAMFVGRYGWFGKMGVTFNYLSNNLQILIILAFIVVKLFLFYLVLGLCRKFSLYYRRKKISYLKYFMMDFISMTPTMTISALSSLLQAGDYTFKERLNIFMHVCTFFVVILMPFGFILASLWQAGYKGVGRGRVDWRGCAFRQEAIYRFLKFLLILFIPVLCTLRNTLGFFTVISLIILLMLSHYITKFPAFSLYSKIIKFLQLLILSVHHIAFLLMLVAKDYVAKAWVIDMVRYLGFIVVFTVVAGGLVELMDFLCISGVNLWRGLGKLYKSKCRRVQDGEDKADGKNGMKNNKTVVRFRMNKQSTFKKPEPEPNPKKPIFVRVTKLHLSGQTEAEQKLVAPKQPANRQQKSKKMLLTIKKAPKNRGKQKDRTVTVHGKFFTHMRNRGMLGDGGDFQQQQL